MLSKDQVLLVSALLGKDVSQRLDAFSNLRDSIGRALTVEDQLFVSANWMELHQFFNSDVGKIAVQTLVQDWKEAKGVT